MEHITPDEMAEAERGAAAYGVTVKDLMENAGRAVAAIVEERYVPLARKKVVVVCGSGNNGGDGFVAARYLSGGCSVTVILLADPGRVRTDEARNNWQKLKSAPVVRVVAADLEALEACAELITKADVILDAILGTGVKGEVREPLATAMRMINASRAAKVAVDIPSGLDPLTGEASCETIRADITVTLHRPKTGLREKEEFAGEVVVAPIGIRE